MILTTAGAAFFTAGAKVSKLLSKGRTGTSFTGALIVTPDGTDALVDPGWIPRSKVVTDSTTPRSVSNDCGL
jgi:hypothetical protein